MGRFIGGLFGNDSMIGRIMTALWIMIASNILFALFSLPVVTIRQRYCSSSPPFSSCSDSSGRSGLIPSSFICFLSKPP